MKIAVTAASGKLGAAIVHATSELVGSGNVIALARTPARAQSLGVEVRAGDYEDQQGLQTALTDIDTLLLISGMDAPDKRIIQHRNVIAAAKAAGVQKIVYTSIEGPEQGTAFSPIVRSNRQTEEDVKACGLRWAIGRNGIYIEPDLEAIAQYQDAGEISNCAGDGKCGYTSRAELAAAYAQLLVDSARDGETCNLHGEPITQAQLAAFLSDTYGVPLRYRALSVADYRAERIAVHGEFMGTVIAGIYQGIREGFYDLPSDYEKATGRAHQSWPDFFADQRAGQSPATPAA